MASLRGGYGLPARPSDGLRPRRMDETGSSSNVPRPLNRTARKEPDIPRAASAIASQSRLPSRVPQPSSTRRPTIPQPSPRSLPDYQSQSWGSTSTTISAAASARTGAHAQSGSGSSSSGRSYDSNLKPARNVLRRKKSSIAHEAAASRNGSPRTSSSSSQPYSQGSLDPALGIHFDRAMTESPGEIYIARSVEISKSVAPTPLLYPELDRYRDYQRPGDSDGRIIEVPYRLATHDLPPPTPVSFILSGNSSQVSAFSGSPSTKFSESPGPGSYSRDTTPTSMSSQSPGLTVPRSFNSSRGRQQSPAFTRPPITRRRAGTTTEVDSITADPQGLAAVRESLTSSSSNSTVRDGDKNAKKNKKPAKRLPPPPPSPPPRKSSQKFRQTRDEADSPPKPTRDMSRPQMVSPSPSKTTPSPRPPLLSPVKGTPPSRPSRNGTPDMQSQFFGPIPVIHSNLSTSSLHAERRGSEPTMPTSASSPQPIKNASTSHLPVSRDASSTSRITGKTSEPEKKLAIPEPPRPATRTPSPNVSSSRRFPFFGRRKTDTDAVLTEKADKKKAARKGPAAGTGHEGYGRLGAVRRRSGSSSTNLARGVNDTQSSRESLISSDPFLADRVNPVIISGGEIIENRNTSSELARTQSNQSLSYGRPSTESKVSSEMSSTSSPAMRNTLWPSAIPRGPNQGLGSRRPSDSSDSDGLAMKSTIAFRRSVQRLRSSPENPIRLPHPINTTGVASSPMTSFDTSVMSDDSHFDLQQEISRGRSNPAHPAPKKLTKRARSPRKWNLFSRSQSRSASTAKEEKVAATVKPVEKKPLAYYTMMDSSEQEDSDIADIKEVLRRADVYPHSPKLSTPDIQQSEFRTPEMPPPAISTPPQPIRSPQHRLPVTDVSRTKVSSPQPVPTTMSTGRPSRLPQVGRIPKVVSNRRERASPKSFSRPFRASMQPPPPAPEPVDTASIAQGPSPPELPMHMPELSMDGSSVGSGTVFTPAGVSVSKVSPEINRAGKEFIAFSPRKNSEDTVGTSSSSSGMYSFAGATAVIPLPHDPPVDDEVWDEYNDLLGEDKPPLSATSSKGTPFHLETYEEKLAKQEKPMASPTIAVDSRKVSMHSFAPTRSSTYSADMTERIRNAFQPHLTPPMPDEGFEFVSTPRERAKSFDKADNDVFKPRPDSSSSGKARQSVSSSGSSDNGSPLAQVNLRVGSMTVSKWLTFGHVLFSDVRHELIPVEGSLKRHSILVIDGLGNDDWSFYAAETYPAATFYNLSPRAPLPEELQSSPTGFPLSPPNHHQIQYVSHIDKFPFAPQSFTCVVYRFPVAGPEACYRNILAEARRVLKPGGYLELSILDVDLNNMGNQGRRTVRRLKEGIHLETPDTNLASTADLMVRLLGKAGFSGIKAARVGVPVASTIARPKDNDKLAGERKKKNRDQPSLAEMMRDESGMADDGITKMVSRVGRWWYTRCYENATSSSPGRSIWSDKALLRECEELGTSLKLMVCCARAPDRVTSF